MRNFVKNKIGIRLLGSDLTNSLILPFTFIAFILSGILSGCNKLIDVNLPVDKLVISSVFADSATAQAAMNGVYSQMYNVSNGSTGLSVFSSDISILPAESADELVPVQNTFDQFASNSLISGNASVSNFWANCYNIIYLSNNVIEGTQASGTISIALKKQLTGEAKFIRAFCNFYLVNYFGKVPLITTGNIDVSNNAPAATAQQVYSQITADLIDARDVLAKDYSWSGGDRTRVNSYVASALLARVYLYTSQWALAEQEATKVINQTSLYAILPDLNGVFLANSQEAIWQFYTNVEGCTFFAKRILPSGNGVPYYAINSLLINAFESGDARKTNWMNTITVGNTYTYPSKYKSITDDNTEFDMVLRLAEQYLIRAEARAQQGSNLAAAAADLNVIRTRANLPGTTAEDKTTVLLAIAHERQVELFCEYGHRWLDLKRTNTIDAVLGAEKPGVWKSTAALYPIPLSALTTNPKLTQNPGY
jgi:hypothetical protein